jgi:hypothetical protein
MRHGCKEYQGINLQHTFWPTKVFLGTCYRYPIQGSTQIHGPEIKGKIVANPFCFQEKNKKKYRMKEIKKLLNLSVEYGYIIHKTTGPFCRINID